MKKKRIYFHEIYDLSKNAYPYRNLTLDDVKGILMYMHNRFPRLAWVSSEDMLAVRPRQSKALYDYYFENLSMIPDEKQYLVIDESSDTAIGILDEAFVAEYGKPGVKFIIRGSPWKIMNVTADKIHVKSVDDPIGAIPSWVGEEIPVPFEVAQEVGEIREFVEDRLKKGEKTEEIAAQLAERYPSDKDTILRAIAETVETIRDDYPVPTDRRITVEDWEEFVILNAHFGSLANRALAQIIGHILSEQMGYAITVQHDPYRIFIQTLGEINSEAVTKIIDELKDSSPTVIQKMLTEAAVKTGIFKRRMIHVAKRFGALKKGVDFSNVSIRSLMKSFEDTVIYEEALREVFTKDLDLKNALRVFDAIKQGQTEVVVLETKGVATPIARLGIERVSMKTDLIPPEKMKRILIESVKVRLLDETRTFICTKCWNYLEMIRIKDLPEKPACPRCGSSELGLLHFEENEVVALVEKRGEKPTKDEKKTMEEAAKTAKLISEYGKAAAVALSGKRVRVNDVEEVLSEENTLTDRFFELIIEAERKALKRRFWAE